MRYFSNHLKKFLILMCLTLASTGAAHAKLEPRLLVVISGYGEAQGEVKPGYEMEELASAYNIFVNNGISVDIASPQGGAVEADKYNPEKTQIAKFLNDEKAFRKLENTLAIADADAQKYDAIFIVGGKGAMFDLPNHKPLQRLIADIYQNQRVVSAVCHGPAALVDVKLGNGEYLISGKSVNGFTNLEEKLFSKRWAKEFDFWLEDKLIERGAEFKASPIMLSHVEQDNRLITGQNPTSTAHVAEAVVRSLGIEPVERELDIDEKTMMLISEYLAGNESVMSQLHSAPDGFNRQLITLYGFYYAKVAKNASTHVQAIALMEVMAEQIPHPPLHLQLATSYKAVNKTAQAKSILQKLVDAQPDFEAAKVELAKLQ